ncbi:MAG: patatin-like phospholipase family protein [Polyangiaceae bacterium]|jgi:NTE family protein|nr:patatin-like phospholipase family protein [Polyangiaceae bacterium]
MPSSNVAFVATGGGSRAIAHLGVLRACEELGLAPGTLVGVGTGALVAALYGQRVPLDVLLDAYRLPWRRRHRGPRLGWPTFFGPPKLRHLADPAYLVSGFFSLDGLERYLARTLPCNDFRRASSPIFVVALDVDAARPIVFGPGHRDDVPISQAVAASCCWPGVFRPYRAGGVYCVGGDFAAHVAPALAVEAGASLVLVSNTYRPEPAPGGRSSLARRGGLGVVRQALGALMHDNERFGALELSRRQPPPTLVEIAPDLGARPYLSALAARRLVLRGYREGLRRLAEARRQGLWGGEHEEVKAG